MSELPPAKKLRLSKPFVSKGGVSNNENTKKKHPFVWTKEMVGLLVEGFVRTNTTYFVGDIGGIVEKYCIGLFTNVDFIFDPGNIEIFNLSDDSILLNFQSSSQFQHCMDSSCVFTPYISKIFEKLNIKDEILKMTVGAIE